MRKNSLSLTGIAVVIALWGWGCSNNNCPQMQDWFNQAVQQTGVQACMSDIPPQVCGSATNPPRDQGCQTACNNLANATPPPSVVQACSPSQASPPCPPTSGQTTSLLTCNPPPPSGGDNLNNGRDGIGAIRNEELGHEYDLQPAASTPQNNLASSSGTSGTAAAPTSAPVATMPPFPSMSAANNSSSPFTGGSTSDDSTLAASPQPDRAIASDDQSKTLSSGAGFGDVAKTGGAKSEDPFGSLFGTRDAQGAAGGVSAVGYGGKDAGATDLDAYLKLVGNRSLFQIVNERYDRWGADLQYQNEQPNPNLGNGSAF